jgi:MFS family permease
MRCSVIDGLAFSVMVGVAQEYLAAFIFEISRDARAAGLITTIPVFLGSLLQLVSPWAVSKLGSNRRWVVWCAATQGFMMFPLAVAAFMGDAPLWLIFLLATIYHGTSLATGAAWTAWIAQIVPPAIRSHWFGKRNRWLQLATLSGVLVGGAVRRVAESMGLTLSGNAEQAGSIGRAIVEGLPMWARDALTSVDMAMAAFALLFIIGGLGRAVSAWFLWRQTERLPLTDLPKAVSLRTIMETFGGNQTGRTLLYMCALGVAMQVAQPFFNPYALGVLNVGAGGYTLLIAAPYLGRMLVLPAFGRLIREQGLRRVMRFAGLIVVPLPLMWMCSGDPVWTLVVLALAQLVLGAAMGSYELSSFLMLYESIPESRRVNAITTFYVGSWLAGATGSLIGSTVIVALTESRGLLLATWGAFGLSVLLRAATIPLLRRATATPGELKPGVDDPVLLQDAKT